MLITTQVSSPSTSTSFIPLHRHIDQVELPYDQGTINAIIPIGVILHLYLTDPIVPSPHWVHASTPASQADRHHVATSTNPSCYHLPLHPRGANSVTTLIRPLTHLCLLLRRTGRASTSSSATRLHEINFARSRRCSKTHWGAWHNVDREMLWWGMLHGDYED